MRKSIATAKFNQFYDMTYDDAVAFIAGKTGCIDIVNDILIDTYSAVYNQLLKIKTCNDEQIQNYFFICLKDSINNYWIDRDDTSYFDKNIIDDININSEKILSEILDTDIDLSEQQATEKLLFNKINSYIMQQNDLKRKSFILHFYYGYPTKQVSKLLAVPINAINNSLISTLKEIRSNFLKEYISKGVEK